MRERAPRQEVLPMRWEELSWPQHEKEVAAEHRIGEVGSMAHSGEF